MVSAMRKNVWIALAFSMSCCVMMANDWYVDASMEDDNGDGTSAATAKKYIQSAIDLVGNGDTVYVAPGRYNQASMVCAFNNNAARVVITNKINLVATGKKEETIIDGGGEMRCLYVYSKSTSPTYTKADGTVIRGFTICNGSTSGYGGGATITSSYMIDCVVSNNVTAARGGGIDGGTAIRCLVAENSSASDSNYGSAASTTRFLNSVIAFTRGPNRLFNYAGMVVNCTIVGNTIPNYTFGQSRYYLYNTIFIGNSSQKFQSDEYTVASNCVFTAGTTGWSESLCGNIKTEVPDYCFAGPAVDDWRPTAEFNIGSHGDAELLKKFSLPAELEDERYIDYNGKPIAMTGPITCGAVQEVCTTSRSLLKLPAGFEVANFGKTTPSVGNSSTFRYLWTEEPGLYKIRKAGSGIGDVVWYSAKTNDVERASLLPDTNNWVAVYTYANVTNSISAVAPNKTYYVDAESGDDSYEGTDIGTAEHPYATIQAAIDVAPTGKDNKSYKSYVIVVRKGEYRTGGTANGRVDVPNKVGSTWQYRNFRIVSADGPEKTFIIGARGDGDNGLGEGAIRCVRSAIGTFIQGFTLTDGHASEGAAFWSNSTGNGAIADCIVSNNCSSASIIYKVRMQRSRVEGNKVTSANVGDVRDSIVTMCEIVQSGESAASSYAVVSTSTYVYFSAVKGRCHAGVRYYASILGGGQSIGTSGGYAKYCFAQGEPFVAAVSGSIQNCQNGKSKCRDFDGGDFHIRSDSPAFGMVTFDPSAYYTSLTLDIEGNLPPLDTLDGWAAGPRQKASWEFVPRGMSLSFK